MKTFPEEMCLFVIKTNVDGLAELFAICLSFGCSSKAINEWISALPGPFAECNAVKSKQ
jgi:hypothetical protein